MKKLQVQIVQCQFGLKLVRERTSFIVMLTIPSLQTEIRRALVPKTHKPIGGNQIDKIREEWELDSR